MAVQTITYDDKVALNVNPDIANVNKVTDNDMNEIKSVVNNNALELSGIIESGNNANGNWIKFADGTMICYKRVTKTLQCNKAWGSVYESENFDFGNMPQEFIEKPFVFAKDNGRSAIIEGLQRVSTTYCGDTWIFRPVIDSSPAEYNFDYLAIGRWK